MIDLSAFLAHAAARPLEWGRSDCCLMVADWIAARSGVDPAPDLRAVYDDESGAMRVIEAEGGIVALFARRVTRAGLARTEAVRPGDVAVVAIGGTDTLFGAIAARSGWAIKTKRGLVISRVPRLVTCWTFADG